MGKISKIAQFDLDSDLAQVVIGVRRSGKSMLCLKVLKESGKNFGYGDFDYLFLDEVQNVSGWHLWVNKLLRQGIHITLTGSNATLPSSDLATHLTGRYNEIPLFPFSFEEYCHMKGLDTKDLTTRNQAILFQGIHKFSFKSAQRIRGEKAYLVDVAFQSDREDTLTSGNPGFRLENIVYIELLRRYKGENINVFCYRDNFEVDFIIVDKTKVLELIQVTLKMDKQTTRQPGHVN